MSIEKNKVDKVVPPKVTKKVEPKNEVSVIKIQNEVSKELASPAVMASLIATTFKGLSELSVKKAITEGLTRGFKFKDFLEKNVYAIPFKDGYSLITSIDYARKIGMRSGVVGKSAPRFEVAEDGKVISCSITIKKLVNGVTGEFTDTAFFSEYYKTNTYKSSLWDTKPRTMIAKVAEMHALRMACPEELAQAYVEEEMSKEVAVEEISKEEITIHTRKLESAKDLKELATYWANLPIELKKVLEKTKELMKQSFVKSPKEVKEVEQNEDNEVQE